MYGFHFCRFGFGFFDERFFYQIRRFDNFDLEIISYLYMRWIRFFFFDFATFIFPDNVGILKLNKQI